MSGSNCRSKENRRQKEKKTIKPQNLIRVLKYEFRFKENKERKEMNRSKLFSL